MPTRFRSPIIPLLLLALACRAAEERLAELTATWVADRSSGFSRLVDTLVIAPDGAARWSRDSYLGDPTHAIHQRAPEVEMRWHVERGGEEPRLCTFNPSGRKSVCTMFRLTGDSLVVGSIAYARDRRSATATPTSAAAAGPAR